MKYISTIIILWSLFTACDMGGGSEPVSNRKAAVRIVIDAAGIQGRTVKPALALQDVTEWELLGGKQGEEQTALTRFASAADASISIDSGTWNFTLVGYKESAVILQGSITGQTISSSGTNTLNFTVAPALDGEGSLSLTIELPAGSGITEAQVFKDGQLHATLTPVDEKVVFEGAYTAGAYYFSIRLYKGDVLYGAVSEAVHVWTNLLSEKTYTLTNEDLNLTYIITYHLWDEETENGYYRNTDAVTLLMPFRADYAFKGWYESADYSGSTVSAIPVGSEGDKDFYAKWAGVEQVSSGTLAQSLAWISANAVEGGAYGVTVNANETISPTVLYYTVDAVSIVLNGGAAERIVSLSTNGSFFTINSGVTLTLGNNITLQGRSSNTAGLVQVNEGGTLTMEDGSKLIGNSNTSSTSYGGGVYVNSGTFAMNGGEISNNTVSSNNGGGVYVSSGTFAMSGGAINGNTASYGGGVYASGGTFVMNGGEITGNTGGGVYASGGAFTMSGGAINSNTASNGGGVYSNGIFTMSGGAISGNTASTSGGGVYSSGILTMSNGEISNNTASTSYGGGVYVYSGAWTMSGGTFNGNTAPHGGGVYVNGGTFIKQSGGVIYGSNVSDSLKNTATSGDSYGHAVYVSSDSKIRNTTAGIGITLDSGVSGTAGGWETSISSSLSLAESLAWISANAVEGGIYTVTLSANESLAPQTLSYSGKIVSIIINSGSTERTVGLSSNGSLFTIESGVTLLLGNNVTMQGRSSNTAGLVRVNSGGTLEMNAGSKITGNTNTNAWGGGVYVNSGGVVTMNGGEISGNTASSYGGGGVYINGGTWTMGGGTISGNTAGYGGGGVYVNSGTFAKQGGTIYGSNADAGLKNTATNGDSFGHAVYVSSGSKKRNTTAGVSVNLDSAVNGAAGGWETPLPGGLSLVQSLAWISTNAEEGGIYVVALSDNESIAPQTLSYSGKNVSITLNGGDAERTVSLSSAGSLFTVESNVTLTLGNNVTLQGLSDNTAGLVQVNSSGALVMNAGSKISGNTSASDGGGVSVDSGGTFTMDGGVIGGNTASDGGGVFVVEGGTFTKQGGIIYGSDADEGLRNTASSGDGYGHAVYAEGSPDKVRDTTAGSGVALNNSVSGGAGGWETPVPSGLTLAESLAWISENAIESGVYAVTISADEEIGPQALSYDGKNLNIMLNGGSAEQTVSLSSAGSLFTVGSGVTLTLGNNVTLQGLSDNTTSLVSVGSNGALVMNTGSRVNGNTNSSSSGGGVSVSGGTFTMSGGEISGNTSSTNGGGVYNNGTFTMEGGEISGNTSSSDGGGVYVGNGRTFTMSGGEISGNTSSSNGGGVSVYYNGIFRMGGGEVSGNTTYYGGGVCVYSSGTFRMSGGEVSGNTASSGSGGGVYVDGQGMFTKQAGGAIYGSNASESLKNTATNGADYGHAVYVDGSPAKIRNITAGTSVNLDSSVSGSAGGWEGIVEALARISANAEEGGDYTITLNADESIAPQTLSYSGKNVSITLNGGSAERTISLSSTGSLFTVGSGVTLTLGNNVTLQGLSSNTAGLVYVNSGGTLVTSAGSKITGNTSSSAYGGGGVYNSGTFMMSGGAISGNTSPYGGGVYVVSSGTFTMSGGTISGNTASSTGGGVYVYNGGTFTMSGGAISGNATTSYFGGGVFVYSGGTFTKQSGGTIYGSNASESLKNTANNGDSYGHAVYVNSSPAKLRNTTAGASVNLDSSVSGSAGGWETDLSLAESLALISANAVEGGVYTITLNADESIAPQTLSYSGKNVSITLNGESAVRTVSLSSTGSLFTVGSGVTLTLGNNVTLQGLSSNTAPLVQIISNGALVMNAGSKITGNTNTSSSYYGGGVRVYSGTFTMSGGEINGNTSYSYGGGVYMNGGTFTMEGGAISGNTASSYGGGVYVYGTFTKQSGGTIYGSNADSSLKNTASSGASYGHAVYVYSGGKIRNSTAGTGVTLNSGTSGSAGGWETSEPISDITYSSVSGGTWTLQSNGWRKSPTIDHNGITKARISFTSNVSNTSITIQLEVSSESGYDYAFISQLDNADATYQSGYYTGSVISGSNTVTITIPVPTTGSHFIDIGYRKDGSQIGGSDCAWFIIQ